MGHLLLIRHGQSEWNLQNRFTGWVDVDLSEKGVAEANQASELVKRLSVSWDVAHTSRLKRAQRTLEIILTKIKQRPPIWIDSALNERHYGDLTGLNKDETRQKFGAEQVHIWRRSFDIAPPHGESLQDTSKRTLPYFREYILPDLKAGKNILVSAHGNSNRSIVMFLEKLSQEKIVQTELETGVPYLYKVDSAGEVVSKTKLS